MAYVIINIGSNLGNKRLNLSRAMNRIGREFGEFEMSHVVESPAWGFDSSHSFLNFCMMFRSELEPHEILHRLQAIEHDISPASHRNPDGSYADRIIDIDIVAIDDMVINDDDIKIPHPSLSKRKFFLTPLAEIAPGWVHPISGKTADEMLIGLCKESDQ